MHDFFEVLGIPDNARASEVRRACARRVRRCHPDFRLPGVALEAPRAASPIVPAAYVGDVAVDFVDVATFVDRIQAAFFAGVN